MQRLDNLVSYLVSPVAAGCEIASIAGSDLSFNDPIIDILAKDRHIYTGYTIAYST
jgi:hypothetical protein